MNCQAIDRLLKDYNEAAMGLLQSFQRVGTSADDRQRWEQITEEARRLSGDLMAAIQSHLAEHRCQFPK